MRRLPFLLLTGSVAALAITWLGGVRHDYISYLDQWELVLAGRDPWSTNNAYGPLHNAFALLVPLHPLAPKLFSTIVFLIANALLVIRLSALGGSGWKGNYLLAIGLNGVVWISGFWYGNNDVVAASLIGAATLARMDRRFIVAGLALGLAALDKYYPLLLIPFFALDERRIEAKLLIAGLATVAAGMALAALIWGQALLDAIIFGVSRGPKLLSILNTLDVVTARTTFAPIVNLAIRLNGPAVLATWLLAIGLAWWWRLNWLIASTIGLLAVLVVYKVGHQQFYLPWLTLVASLPLLQTSTALQLARRTWPYCIFLAVFSFGFGFFGQYNGILSPVRDYVGLFAFVTSLLALTGMLKVSFPRPTPPPLDKDLRPASRPAP